MGNNGQPPLKSRQGFGRSPWPAKRIKYNNCLFWIAWDWGRPGVEAVLIVASHALPAARPAPPNLHLASRPPRYVALANRFDYEVRCVDPRRLSGGALDPDVLEARCRLGGAGRAAGKA